jgi:zinc transport system ATP-binding protein
MLLSVHQLTAGYAEPVLGPVTFSLERGEILGLVGPNGCGKSTLLSALLGAVRIFSGEVTRAPGLVVTLQTQQQPDVAGVPLTGAELLSLTGAGRDGLPLWLHERLGERLDRLSGGQRQFLYLWSCLQAPGDVVLLDEPTNNLDPDGVAHLAGALKMRAAEGGGLVVVSHDAEFLASVCSRLIRMGEA